MSDAKPYPKAQQLGRGARKYRRKVASPKQWQAIIAAKGGTCRVCEKPARWTGSHHRAGRYPVCFHHVVPRDLHGDDVADNIVPVCFDCHTLLHRRDPDAGRALITSLTDGEYAYAVCRLGEAVWERVYGIEYQR